MSCKNVKLAILGASGVGKSAMVVRFITGRFLHHYDPTLEDEYLVETTVNGQLCNVSILDTAGIEEKSSHSCVNYLSLVDAVLVVFSLESQSSLEVARQLLRMTRNTSLPAVLVGTKCDLRSHQRILSYDGALEFAGEYGCSYLETSSAVNINVLEAFHAAIDMVLTQQPSAHQTEPAVKPDSVEKKKSKRRVRSIWSRLNLFKRDKKLLDSLAASTNPIEVDLIRLSTVH